MPRDLKDPEGCVFSSFKKTLLYSKLVLGQVLILSLLPLLTILLSWRALLSAPMASRSTASLPAPFSIPLLLYTVRPAPAAVSLVFIENRDG